jgi:hypothetical protein
MAADPDTGLLLGRVVHAGIFRCAYLDPHSLEKTRTQTSKVGSTVPQKVRSTDVSQQGQQHQALWQLAL